MVWKNYLLIKLERLNITGYTFDLISDFLTDPTIHLRVGDALSDVFCHVNGTAQGSIISQLLFLIIINFNDLPDVLVNVESSLLADDSAVFKLGKNLKYVTQQIHKNLDKLEK